MSDKKEGWERFKVIDLHEAFESTARLFRHRPRRWLFVLLAAVIFIIWGGIFQLGELFKEILKILAHKEIGLGPDGVKLEGSDWFEIGKAIVKSEGIWQLLVSFIFSFFLTVSMAAFVSHGARKEFNLPTRDRLNLLIQVLTQCGIGRGYPVARGQTKQQHYADDIRAEAGISKTLRMMSIAGWEYIGAGSDSLLYEVVQTHPEMRSEFLFVNPDLGTEVIANRASALNSRDPTYTSDRINQEIRGTLNLLKGLKPTNSQLEIWQCSCPTVFRLVILDKCLFVSAYRSDAHGHESPMLRIDRGSGEVPNDWYHAFEQFYAMVKAHSARFA